MTMKYICTFMLGYNLSYSIAKKLTIRTKFQKCDNKDSFRLSSMNPESSCKSI